MNQPGILAALPLRGRYLSLSVRSDSGLTEALRRLAEQTWDSGDVFGFGEELAGRMGRKVPGLRPFGEVQGSKVELPSTGGAAWLWLRGDDPGELVLRGRKLAQVLEPGFVVSEAVDAFRYQEGRDLSGYVDGTENPGEERASEVAVIADAEPGIDGGSFVSVQRWIHDLDGFSAFSRTEQDEIIGRRLSDNEELEDAPETAHVKRTAQEDFEPEAFLLRRSMPYTLGQELGLMFVAFAASLRPFEAQLSRMSGAEDGIVDALFRFTRPCTGAHYFCPPLSDGKLDLRSLLEAQAVTGDVEIS